MNGANQDPIQPRDIDLGHVIERSRGLISGSKRYGVYLVLTSLAILLGVGLVSNILFEFDPISETSGPWWWEVTTGAFTSGIIAMLTVAFGLYRAKGSQLTYRALFDFLETLWPYLVITFPAALLTLMADNSGNWLFRLAAAALVFPVTFAPFFMVDRKMGPLDALGHSFSLVLANIGPMLLFVLLAIFLTLVSIVTLGFGFIWTMPFLVIANAVIYDEAVGIRGEYAL